MYFEEILNRISPTLKKITKKLNGKYSYIDDNDLFQEALLFLWNSFKDGKLANKTDSYILQGCYFYLKNYLRNKDKKINFINIEDIDLRKTNTFINLSTNDSTIKDIYDILKNSLSAKEREILKLYLNGMTMREIGNKFNVSHVMIVKMMKKIRNKCKKFKEEFKR